MNETNEKVTCYFCGEAINKNESMEFLGKTLCRNCYDANVTTCECCGDLIWESNSRGDENITLCQDCYDDHYTHCESRNRVIHNEDAYYEDDSSDYPYCESCYNRLIELAIKSYRYKPEPIFYGNNDMYMGVELEIDKDGETHDNAEKLLDIANMNGEHIYCKHDGMYILNSITNYESCNTKNMVVQDIIGYINENFKLIENIDEIAKALNYSKSYISAVFKRNTGISIHDYLIQKRMIHTELLHRNGESLTSACIKSGFTSYGSYAYSYKQLYKKSPKSGYKE